jgi:hypothetical protein
MSRKLHGCFAAIVWSTRLFGLWNVCVIVIANRIATGHLDFHVENFGSRWQKKNPLQSLGIEPRFSGPQPEVLTTIRRLPKGVADSDYRK